MSNGNNKGDLITKSISMPSELFLQADEKVNSEQEMNWSKYVRDLIRRDLADKSKFHVGVHEEVAA